MNYQRIFDRFRMSGVRHPETFKKLLRNRLYSAWDKFLDEFGAGILPFFSLGRLKIA